MGHCEVDDTVDVVVVVVVVVVVGAVKPPVPNDSKILKVAWFSAELRASSREAEFGASHLLLSVLYHGLFSSLHLLTQSSVLESHCVWSSSIQSCFAALSSSESLSLMIETTVAVGSAATTVLTWMVTVSVHGSAVHTPGFSAIHA